MITEKDLQNAIAECQGERHPNANTCIKLAAYYTIYENLYPKQAENPVYQPVIDNVIGDYGDTEFYRAIKGKKSADIWAVMGELMDTIQFINPKLYDGVMRQLL